jgi:hypothetical protein
MSLDGGGHALAGVAFTRESHRGCVIAHPQPSTHCGFCRAARTGLVTLRERHGGSRRTLGSERVLASTDCRFGDAAGSVVLCHGCRTRRGDDHGLRRALLFCLGEPGAYRRLCVATGCRLAFGGSQPERCAENGGRKDGPKHGLRNLEHRVPLWMWWIAVGLTAAARTSGLPCFHGSLGGPRGPFRLHSSWAETVVRGMGTYAQCTGQRLPNTY